MAKETKFILLQGSVVFNQQIGLFDVYEDTKEGRNKAFRDVIEKFISKKVVKVNPRTSEYVLLYKLHINDNLLYCQLARKTQLDTYNLEGNDIKQGQIDNYPPLDVFIDLRKQQFAVELNTTILAETAIESTISKLFNSLTKGFNIFINAIQNTNEFWELVKDEDAIQEISFDLIAPNFFNATGAASDLVSGAKEELNADSVVLSFKNKKGKLKAEIEAIDSFVKYSSATGSWKLKIKQNGQTRYKTITSTDCCKKKFLDAAIVELFKKMDQTANLGMGAYQALIARIEGLFDDEE